MWELQNDRPRGHGGYSSGTAIAASLWPFWTPKILHLPYILLFCTIQFLKLFQDQNQIQLNLNASH